MLPFLPLYLLFPSPFLPLCFFVSGCERMSASWMGSANRFAVICPNVVDVRICTAISQANVSHSALILGSLWAFRLVSVLNLSMYVVISVSAPICIRIQAHWMASRASMIIMDVCGSQSLVSCCTREKYVNIPSEKYIYVHIYVCICVYTYLCKMDERRSYASLS